LEETKCAPNSWTFGDFVGDLLLSEREYRPGFCGDLVETRPTQLDVHEKVNNWLMEPRVFSKKTLQPNKQRALGINRPSDQATKRPSDKIINNPSSQSNQPIHQSNQIKSNQVKTE
jgi:hypothetical protein